MRWRSICSSLMQRTPAPRWMGRAARAPKAARLRRRFAWKPHASPAWSTRTAGLGAVAPTMCASNAWQTQIALIRSRTAPQTVAWSAQRTLTVRTRRQRAIRASRTAFPPALPTQTVNPPNRIARCPSQSAFNARPPTSVALQPRSVPWAGASSAPTTKTAGRTLRSATRRNTSAFSASMALTAPLPSHSATLTAGVPNASPTPTATRACVVTRTSAGPDSAVANLEASVVSAGGGGRRSAAAHATAARDNDYHLGQ